MPETNEQVTPIDVPHPRWSIPGLELPEGAGVQDLARALATVLMQIHGNMEYIRAREEARLAQETVNAFAIRVQSDLLTKLENRYDAIVGRRWGRIIAIHSAKLRLAAQTASYVFLCVLLISIAIVACVRR